MDLRQTVLSDSVSPLRLRKTGSRFRIHDSTGEEEFLNSRLGLQAKDLADLCDNIPTDQKCAIDAMDKPLASKGGKVSWLVKSFSNVSLPASTSPGSLKTIHMSRVGPALCRSQSAIIDSPSSESASFKSPASTFSADSWGDQKLGSSREAGVEERQQVAKEQVAVDILKAHKVPSLVLPSQGTSVSPPQLQIGPIARMNFRKELSSQNESLLLPQAALLSVVIAKHSSLGEPPSLDLNPFSPYSLGILETEPITVQGTGAILKQPIDLNEYCSRVNVRPKEEDGEDSDSDSDEEQDWEDSVEKTPDTTDTDALTEGVAQTFSQDTVQEKGAPVGDVVSATSSPSHAVEPDATHQPPESSDLQSPSVASSTESEEIVKQWRRRDHSPELTVDLVGAPLTENAISLHISNEPLQAKGPGRTHSTGSHENSPVEGGLVSGDQSALLEVEESIPTPGDILAEGNMGLSTGNPFQDDSLLPTPTAEQDHRMGNKPSRINTTRPPPASRHSNPTSTTMATTATTNTTVCATATAATTLVNVTTDSAPAKLAHCPPTVLQRASSTVFGLTTGAALKVEAECPDQQVVSSRVSRSGKLFARKTKTIAQFEYNTSKKLGKGNFGIVYHGRRKGEDHEVAVKKITRKLPGEIEKLGLVQREMRVCRAFRNKVGIVPLLDIITTNKHHYLVFERAETDLAEMIKLRCRDATGGKSAKDPNQQPMTPSHALGTVFHIQEIRSIMHTVVLGTQALHLEGYSHKDIKPANILFMNGQGMLCDFGLCSQRDELPLNQFFGTQDYAAPEARRAGGPKSNKCDYIRSDIYSLGAVFYELATGVVLSKVISRGVNYPKIALFGGESFSELLQGMVNDPEKRWTIDQVVKSRFWSESNSLSRKGAANLPVEESLDIDESAAKRPFRTMSEKQPSVPADIPLPATPNPLLTPVG
ncbi:hypothetical protein BGZ70_008550 [Mortierella alpina]|uniref:non-specific serine/threonine protein kinase n=1 Tax=Mortierella alpina TaxID=64518 RepID=A0A9P6J3H5_MORAP|nr:hypothetical protein BGZ70_008550 [Mortierella alpina]